ncbi:putative aminohydrolase SsnA [Miniphocaeibacter halophilus]|uniref:Aminohydrolase SsnA n=1 Tax=Miniphocaeibacter halophilus TaxID=2931922 RepID=A0AC61MRP6_9FIRM|nr:putative aminohydrolase SsnA [Miniphocaeibacter halophilus]QQK07129.1 putative aminohydrolase SsnA [Miniphocaeibacter halophilus]
MIIGNGVLITNDADNNFYDCGAVLVKDNVIEDIGTFEDIKAKYPNEEIVDVEGKIIMPGMICAHSHIYSAYGRGMSTSQPITDFYTVLENQWWRLDKLLTTEDVKLNALTTYIESIRNGVTTLIDHHAGPNSVEGSLFTIREAALETGMRTSLCYEVTDRDGIEIAEKGIKENVDFIKACQEDDKGDMIKALFGIHASFTVSDDTLYKSREAMEGVYDGYHVHVAEGIEDQYECLEKHGKRVVNRLHDFDMLGPNTLAVHCAHVSQAEMDILKHTNTKVVTNPESNMNNAIGAPPTIKMMEEGIVVGLGTDAYTNDMFESLKVANILQSHNVCKPSVGFMPAIEAQFKNNPIILAQYYNKPVGKLEKGAYADLITLDYFPHTPINANNWYGHSVFGFTGRLVIDNMINGKFVMKNREIQNVDVDAIHAKSAERAAEVWKFM